MAKKKRKNNKELLKEIRSEGMFKEAEDIANKKVKYTIASGKDGAIIAITLFLFMIGFTLINKVFTK
ncbi:hypothetical protein VN21_12945 [Paraclostridium benzoelyticum]|uniref:Uncharacterized protein n=1 Tax=Paraclostridium benzoelyticum TaxID=1629550 RepID=A0A0M3DEW3_9FIRM|nr:hypothetical protein [Paraclostridium benzoelyticum]KKY00666.1 hypothetical protein VN21_12945 [Paraclostridium benzoelyticum]OXX82651.1 hypothetical protein AVM15_17140 [Paraclostridium benzoelyticum]